MRVDLHLHSTASDGGLSPARLVRRARGAGLDVIALADHDSVGGVAEARAAAPEGLRVIPAIEISASHGAGELHILGYHVDPEAPSLLAYTRAAELGRRERMEGMIRALAGLGVHITLEQVVAEAGPDATNLGRPHLARVLVARKVVRDFGEAFVRFIGDDGPAYVPTKLVDVPQAVEVIHAAGGIAVWAHPPGDLLEPELGAFVAAGLDGVECYRPRTGPEETERIRAVAGGHGLILSGGSDWHGPWDGPLGAFWVEDAAVPEITGRADPAAP